MAELNVVAIDWLTATFYDEAEQYENVRAIVGRVTGRYANSRRTDARRLQYTGEVTHVETGSVFLGSGKQRGRGHNLLQVSGELSGQVWAAGVNRLVFAGYLSVTRLDVQATVAEPVNWSQIELFKRLQAREPERISFIQSVDAGQTLATVYYGRRAGENFVRIYQKLGLGEDRYLRFEVELKGNTANSVAQSLQREKLSGYWTYYFQNIADDALIKAFAPVLVGAAKKPVVFRPERNTAAWLEGQVLDALRKFLSKDSPEAERVADRYQALLDSFYKRRYLQ